MNVQLTFDKLAYIDRLKAAGIDERQARAHAEGLDQALREEVATKTDIAELRASTKMDIEGVRHEIEALRVSTKADIAELRASAKADIEGVKHEIDGVRHEVDGVRHEIEALRLSTKGDLASLEATLLRWFIGTAIALVALTATIVKFVH